MAAVHETGKLGIAPRRARRIGSGAALLAAGALAGLTAGCEPGRHRPQSPSDVVCLREPQTGTHIVETRCFTRAEIDERRKADQQMLERAQMQSNRPARRRDQ
jgi:hypothetical protein